MVVERQQIAHKLADDVSSEVAGPLNDIALDANALLDEYVGKDDLQAKLRQIVDNVSSIRKSLQTVAEGPAVVEMASHGPTDVQRARIEKELRELSN